MKAWLSNILFFMNKYKNLLALIFLILLVLLIALTFIYPSVTFYPANYHYQNYNVVRRLLDGQIPYKEFAVYLGPTHLYLGGFLTFIFGNNITSCAFSYELLTSLIFIFFAFVLGKSLKLKTYQIVILTTTIISMSYFCIKYFYKLPGLFLRMQEMIYDSSTSAKLIRAFPLFLICCFIQLIDLKIKSKDIKTILYGLCAGLAFPCSNDYGISTSIAIFITFFLFKCLQKNKIKEILKDLLIFSFSGFFMLILSATIFSQGHLISWYDATFGVGTYQAWYFSGHKAPSLYNINLDFFVICQFLFTVFLGKKLYLKYKNDDDIKEILKYKVLFILNLTSVIDTQLLNFLSNGVYFVSMTIFYVSVIFYLFYLYNNFGEKIIRKRFGTRMILRVNVIFLSIALSLTLFVCGRCIYKIFRDKSPNTISSIKISKFDRFNEDIIDAKNFIENKKLFSLYSSVLEELTNQFQPAGVDQISHALGDKGRKKYLEIFNQKHFDYVSIQKNEVLLAEIWVRLANWDIYKRIYRYYKPVYTNSYITLLELKSIEDYNKLPKSTTIKYEPISKNEGKIILETDKSINGMADINLDFEIKKINILSKLFTFNPLVCLEYPNIYPEIPHSKKIEEIFMSEKHNRDISIYILNGKGELLLKSVPKHNVELVIKSLSYGNYYESPMKFIEIQEVDYDNNIIKIKKSYLNERLITNVKSIKLDSDIYKIANISLNDNDINIDLDKNIVKSDKKQYFLEIME